MVFPQFLQRFRTATSALFGCLGCSSKLWLIFPVLNILVFPALAILGFFRPESIIPCLMMVNVWACPLNLSLHLTLAYIYRDSNCENLHIDNTIKGRLASKLGAITSVFNFSVFLFFWTFLYHSMQKPVPWMTVLVYTYPAISTAIEVGLRLHYVTLFGPHRFGNALVYLSLCTVLTKTMVWWGNSSFLLETEIAQIISYNLAKLYELNFISTVLLSEVILTAMFKMAQNKSAIE